MTPKLLFIFWILTLISLYSCIAYSTEDIQRRIIKTNEKFQSEKLNVIYKKIYKSEGTFKCNKDLGVISEKLQSTSEVKFQDFLYIYEDGKVLFFGKNIFPGYEKYIDIPKGDFNATFFQQNSKTKVQRIQVFHPILGMDFGKGSFISDVKSENGKLIIKITQENCEVFIPFEK